MDLTLKRVLSEQDITIGKYYIRHWKEFKKDVFLVMTPVNSKEFIKQEFSGVSDIHYAFRYNKMPRENWLRPSWKARVSAWMRRGCLILEVDVNSLEELEACQVMFELTE